MENDSIKLFESKLQKEGCEVSEKIGQLKMKSPDGKKYLTDVADI